MSKKVLPKSIIKFFFVLGIVSATSIRLIAVFNRFNPFISRILWYIGVIGYIFFFGYRFYISKKRRKTILENNLIEKLKNHSLNQEDRDNIVYILDSILKSKEILNYIYIFILSIVAIIVDISLEIFFNYIN